MALPTAPLGQLSGLNLPYSIPTYEKPPSILEKALSAFLVNAAGQAAGKLGDNLTSRDYATEFGEKPASGFGRLLGPQVSEKQASQRREQNFTSGENMKNRAFQSDELTRRLDTEQAQHEVDAGNALLRQGNEYNNALDVAAAQDYARSGRDMQEQDAAQKLARLKAELEANDPYRQAETKKANSEARSHDMFSDMFTKNAFKKDGSQAQTPGSPQVSDAVRKFATGGGQSSGSIPSTGTPMQDLSTFAQGMKESPVGQIINWLENPIGAGVDAMVKSSPSTTAWGPSSADTYTEPTRVIPGPTPTVALPPPPTHASSIDPNDPEYQRMIADLNNILLQSQGSR